MKENIEKYNDLSQSTKDTHVRFLKRIHLAGITLTEFKNMEDNEIRKVLKSNAKSMLPYRRLADQITKNTDVRNIVKDNTIDKFSKTGYKGKELNSIKKDLIKTVGSTFFSIAKDLQDIFKESERLSYKHAKDLLLIPKESYKNLDERERNILKDYNY